VPAAFISESAKNPHARPGDPGSNMEKLTQGDSTKNPNPLIGKNRKESTRITLYNAEGVPIE
jgi:hypothetical protein